MQRIRAIRDIPYLGIKREMLFNVVNGEIKSPLGIKPSWTLSADACVDSTDFLPVKEIKHWDKWVSRKKEEFGQLFGFFRIPPALLYQWIFAEYAALKNGSWKPDWSNAKEYKYNIVFNRETGKYSVNTSIFCECVGAIIFKSSQDARECIEDIGTSILDQFRQYL